jgi:hypothetical protein
MADAQVDGGEDLGSNLLRVYQRSSKHGAKGPEGKARATADVFDAAQNTKGMRAAEEAARFDLTSSSE